MKTIMGRCRWVVFQFLFAYFPKVLGVEIIKAFLNRLGFSSMIHRISAVR